DKAGAGFGGVFFDVGGVHGEFLIGPPAWLGRGVLVFLYVSVRGLGAIYWTDAIRAAYWAGD
ncbi:MAG: hypothetical protein ACTJGL_17040, partial [Vreelandella alkaliphila]